MRHLSGFRRLALAGTALSIVATTGAAPAIAATCTWNGGTGGWGATNWNCGAPGAIPGGGDDVRIDGGNPISSVVSITDDRAANTVTLDNGDQINISNGNLRIGGGSLVNNGAITIGNNSEILGQSIAFSLSGTGTITLADAGNGAYLFSQNGILMTIGSGQTILGAGNIGANQGVIVNNGTIDANSASVLTLDAQGGSGGIGSGNGVGVNSNSAFLNNGLAEATGGATLTLGAGYYENGTNGSFKAIGSGSIVHLNDDVRIANGVLSSSNGGHIEMTSGTQYLQDVTLANGTAVSITNDNVRIDGTLVNNGTILINNNAEILGETATTNLSGTGTIQLSNAGNGAYLFNSNGTTMTIGGGQTVFGAGNIGDNQGVLINNGTIDANAAGVLTLDAQGGSNGIGSGNGTGTNTNTAFLNNGLIEATGGSTLVLAAGLYENAGSGAIKALGGSTVHLNDDVRILNGTLTSTGAGGKFEMNSGTQYLQNVTLASGTAVTITNDTVRIDGTLANNGTIAVNNNSQLIGETATSSLSGTGTIQLSDAGNGAYLYNFNGTTMTIGGGQTVFGAGNIGANQGVLINNGTIDANAAGVLTLDAQGGSGGIGSGNGVGTNTNTSFLNNSLIEATGGSTLVLAAGLYENAGAGSIQAIGGSTVHLNDDVRILNGTLTSTGAGGQFEMNSGTQYLQNVMLTNGTIVTITGDTTRIEGTLANNGTITLGANATLIGETATSDLAGAGTVVMTSPSSTLYNFNGTTMTIESGQTIIGSGDIAANQGILINAGTIAASGAGGLTLDAQGGSGGVGAGNGVGTNLASAFLNTNLIQATGGSLLTLAAGLYENAGAGRIQAVGGSTVHVNDDVRILGGSLTSDAGSQFVMTSGTQYLQGVTLTDGTTVNITGDTARIDGTLTNNGTITLGVNATLLGETGTSNVGGLGTGTVVMTDPSSTLYNFNGTIMTIGNGQLITGSGNIGANQGVIENDGNILSNGALTIDAQGGSGGIGSGGIGTNGNVAFLNNGQVQANNGGATLTLASGLYENTANGSFSAGTGSTFEMNSDASLANLQTGGVLSKGFYGSFTTGATSTLDLRSGATNSIVTIGTNTPGIDTIVTLSGANSVIEVTPLGGGTAATIDSTLKTVAQSGVLAIADGRVFTAAGALSNAGEIRLTDGTIGAPGGLTNSGVIDGHGTIATPVTSSGTVLADGGTLVAQTITGVAGSAGALGTIQTDAGATLRLAGASGTSTAAFLANNGTLALGSNTVLVTSDYTNANFGSGNAFNAHADVTGSGLINAVSATQDLSGAGLSGATLNVGNVRLGGSSSTTLTITNHGTVTTLRGAVESAPTNTVSVSSADFVLVAGASTTVTLSYTGTNAGSLAGQSIIVANNFDNVADQTLNLAGAAYNAASAGLTPNPINLGATRVGGTLSGTVTITNTAPTGAFSEGLDVTGATGSGGASGTVPSGLIAASNHAVSAVALSTATSGTLSGTVTYALATDGTGTSGLAAQALTSQAVTINGKVYQAAIAQLSSSNVTFATVRQGSTTPTAAVLLTNAATGALTDTLNTSVGALPSGVTGMAVGALSGGQSGNLNFAENTATAGNFSGGTTLGFTSTDADLAPLTLASQQLAFTGTVTAVAIADLFKSSGVGTLTGSGTSYDLDLGSFLAGSGSSATDIGVLNAIGNASYDELLQGLFVNSGGSAFSFSSNGVSGLVGGTSDIGNLLSFSYTGLGDGLYTDTLTFNGASHYAGLSDLSLAPITVTIHARITGATMGAVPEPATWSTMLIGFGFIGGAIRRSKKTLDLVKREA